MYPVQISIVSVTTNGNDWPGHLILYVFFSLLVVRENLAKKYINNTIKKTQEIQKMQNLVWTEFEIGRKWSENFQNTHSRKIVLVNQNHTTPPVIIDQNKFHKKRYRIKYREPYVTKNNDRKDVVVWLDVEVVVDVEGTDIVGLTVKGLEVNEVLDVVGGDVVGLDVAGLNVVDIGLNVKGLKFDEVGLDAVWLAVGRGDVGVDVVALDAVGLNVGLVIVGDDVVGLDVEGVSVPFESLSQSNWSYITFTNEPQLSLLAKYPNNFHWGIMSLGQPSHTYDLMSPSVSLRLGEK